MLFPCKKEFYILQKKSNNSGMFWLCIRWSWFYLLLIILILKECFVWVLDDVAVGAVDDAGDLDAGPGRPAPGREHQYHPDKGNRSIIH